MKVFSVGEMLIDFLPGSEAGTYVRKAGGAPANAAIALARQGCDTSFCGMLGNDDFGRFLLETLRENNVTPVVRLTDEAVTTMAFVTLDEQGDRSFTFARKPGADMLLTREQVQCDAFEQAQLVHAGSCSLSKGSARDATVYALSQGHAGGKLISFDVNYRNVMWDDDEQAAARAVREILPFVDFLKISEEEAGMLGGEAQIPSVMEQYEISVVVETLGAQGVRCYWNGRQLELSGLQAACVDATGAGDAFWGAFLAALSRAEVTATAQLTETLLWEALRAGNIAGWLCVQKKGAIESLPTRAQVEHYLHQMYP